MPSPQSTPTEHPTLTFDNEVAIVQAGAIPPLVKLARKGTAGGRKKAAKALKNLSFAPGHKEAIAEAGYKL